MTLGDQMRVRSVAGRVQRDSLSGLTVTIVRVSGAYVVVVVGGSTAVVPGADLEPL